MTDITTCKDWDESGFFLQYAEDTYNFDLENDFKYE